MNAGPGPRHGAWAEPIRNSTRGMPARERGHLARANMADSR